MGLPDGMHAHDLQTRVCDRSHTKTRYHMADLSDAQFYSPIWGKCIPFILKKMEMIMEKNTKIALLLKDKTGKFQGIFCFLGARLVVLLESQFRLHCPLCLEGASGMSW